MASRYNTQCTVIRHSQIRQNNRYGAQYCVSQDYANGFPLVRACLERAMGFGPTTFALARRRTTTVLYPHDELAYWLRLQDWRIAVWFGTSSELFTFFSNRLSNHLMKGECRRYDDRQALGFSACTHKA